MNYIEDYLSTKNVQSLHMWVEENYKIFHDIVRATLKHNSLYNLSPDDLFSEAVIAFYGVVDKYSPETGAFTTFIYKAIGNELLNKIKTDRRHNFQGRIDAVELDSGHCYDGDISVEETVSNTDINLPMNNVMIADLRKLAKEKLSPKKYTIYTKYSQGKTAQVVADEVGVTKQYVSKVIQDIVEMARKEWRLND